MSQLDTLLKQKEEITKYLKKLVNAHREALSDVSDGNQLDVVREHISICFSDLQTINDKLISHTGLLKSEITKLIELRKSILELSVREMELLKEGQLWDFDSDLNYTESKAEGNKFTIETHYRNDMNKYIELVGITNTSLARKEDRHNVQDDKHINSNQDYVNDRIVMTKEDTLKCITYLQAANAAANNDCKVLQTLLNNIQKDQIFLETELKSQNARIRHKRNNIAAELTKVSQTRDSLLTGSGIKLPEQSTSVKNRKNSKDSIEDSIQSAREKLELTLEFIDINKDTMSQRLKDFKSDSSTLTLQGELWAECLEEVTSLERKLKLEIVKNGDKPLNRKDLTEIIRLSIQHLENLERTENQIMVSTIIKDEKETLISACDQLQQNPVPY